MVENWKAPKSDRAQAAEKFEYPEIPGAGYVPSWTGWNETGEAAGPGMEQSPDLGARPAEGGAAEPEFERLIAEQTRQSFEAGRARGREEGRLEERSENAAARAAGEQWRIRQTAEILEQFAAERKRYFEAVEPEVVKLALAVAARILRREASADPLLLIGAVRAALGQMAAAAEVRVLVPAADLDLWTEAIALLPNLAQKPAVVAGEGMDMGECRIETSLGAADLGVRAQLAEIERALSSGRAAGGPEPRRARPQPAAAGNAESAA